MSDQPPVDEKRSALRNDVYSTYSMWVWGMSEASAYLIHRRGNKNEIFFGLYLPFTTIFSYTRHLKEMSKVDEKLIEAIGAWVSGNRASISRGLYLSNHYQMELIKNNVIILRSE